MHTKYVCMCVCFFVFFCEREHLCVFFLVSMYQVFAFVGTKHLSSLLNFPLYFFARVFFHVCLFAFLYLCVSLILLLFCVILSDDLHMHGTVITHGSCVNNARALYRALNLQTTSSSSFSSSSSSCCYLSHLPLWHPYYRVAHVRIFYPVFSHRTLLHLRK